MKTPQRLPIWRLELRALWYGLYLRNVCGLGFVAIAEENRIRVDDLITWIHCRMPGKEWSLAEFRRFAAKLQQLRNERPQEEPSRVSHIQPKTSVKEFAVNE